MKVTMTLDSENAAKMKTLQGKTIKIIDGAIDAMYFGEAVVTFYIEVLS